MKFGVAFLLLVASCTRSLPRHTSMSPSQYEIEDVVDPWGLALR